MVSSIYRGFSSIGIQGTNTSVHDKELVNRDILNHFNTRFGERRGRPDFGSIINDLLMEDFVEETETAVFRDARRIVNSDPRVEEINIAVNIDPDAHSIVLVLDLLYVETGELDSVSLNFRSNTQ